jgi:hypothetical protein
MRRARSSCVARETATATWDGDADDSPPSHAFPPNLARSSLPRGVPAMTPTPNPAKTMPLPKVRRVRIYTRLSHALRRRLHEYCAAAGRSERAVFEDAVAKYLAGQTGDGAVRTPIERVIEAMNHESQQRERLHHDLEILSEAFGRFLRLWMVVHASTFHGNAEVVAKQRAEGEGLFRRFASAVSTHFGKGHRFAQDFLQAEGHDATSTARDP